MRMCRALLPLIVGALSLPLRGQTASPIAQYVDEQTILAGRVDVSKIDTKGLEAFIHQIMEKQGAQEQDFQGLTVARLTADATLERFKTLGGDRVYVLISFPDLWPALDPIAMLVPIRAGGDIKGMEAMFKTLPTTPMMGKETTVEQLNDQLLFVGSTTALKRLKTLHAAPRSELTEALEGSAIACVVVSPTPDMRRVVSEMMPQLPVQFGGGATGEMINHLSSVTLELSLPPTAELTLTAHTGKSESAARGIADAAAHGVDYLKSQPEYKKVTAKGGPLEGHAEKLDALLESFKPVVKAGTAGEEIAQIHLGQANVDEMVLTLSPGVSRAKETAARARSMSNLKQLSIACIMYQQDNKGAWPASTTDIKAFVNNDSVYVSPVDPQHRPYVMEAWTTDEMKALEKASAFVPILYEAAEEPGGGLAVAFSDGHVEFVSTQAKLTEQLAKAHEQVKK